MSEPTVIQIMSGSAGEALQMVTELSSQLGEIRVVMRSLEELRLMSASEINGAIREMRQYLDRVKTLEAQVEELAAATNKT